MEYAELSDDDDYHNQDIETLVSKIKKEFDIDWNVQDSPEIDSNSAYMSALTELKGDYKKEMATLLENNKLFKDFSTKFSAVEKAVMSISTSTQDTYTPKLLEILQECNDSHNIEEIKKKIINSTSKVLKCKKELSITNECGVGNNYICFICLDRGVDTMINPCGHVACSRCVEMSKFDLCPFCRTNVQSTKKFFV
mgnify:CR=1 FL=1